MQPSGVSPTAPKAKTNMSAPVSPQAMSQNPPSIQNQQHQSPTTATAPGGGGRASGNATVYQTTGPDAYTSPVSASDGSGPALNPRSCVACRRRKVRCDKQMPCSNCRRALIPCVYPAPGRAPRQPRPKDPNAPPKQSSSSSSSTSNREVELIKRLKKLEGIVEELSGQFEVESSGGHGASSAGSPSSPAHATGQHGHANSGKRTPASAAALSAAAGPRGRNSLDSNRGSSLASALGPQDGDSPSSDSSAKKDINTHLGRLVLNDHKGNTRYISQGIWAKINDELDNLRDDTHRLSDDGSDHSEYDETPDESPLQGDSHAGDHHSFILGYRSADVDLRPCHPSSNHMHYLWSVYKSHVEPLIKVLHVPTMETLIQKTSQDLASLTSGTEALMFAMYFASVIAMEPEDVLSNLGAVKDDLLRQYRFALEQALARANFLFTSDLAVLQAFVLFLMVVRRVDDSRFCWTLTGLVVRLAQGMGLHRDGSQFDLTPYEAEMRRRLWYSILVLDLRSAEELGSDLLVSEPSYDTRLPLNINDTDISMESTEVPEAREGRSDMAVLLVRYEILMLSRRLITELASKQEQFSPFDREKLLIDVYQRVEDKFLKHVADETDPLYWVGAMVARIVMAKMCLHIYQSKMFPGTDSDLSAEIRDRLWVAAIEVVELGHRLNIDHRSKRWRWLFMTYTNWHAIAFNLIELCRRPWTALAERSWQAVVTFERDPVDLARRMDHAAVFLPLRKLYLRVRKHRDVEIHRLQNNIGEARRLDWAERMNPTSARFGPIPGETSSMDRFREQWWELIQPDGVRQPYFEALSAANGPPMSSMAGAAAPLSQSAMSGDANTASQVPAPGMEFSDAAMEMLDDIMAQPNPALPSFWPTLFASGNAADRGVGFAMDGTNATTDTQGQEPTAMMGEFPQQQQQQNPQQPLGMVSGQDTSDKDLPPWLWSHGWGQTRDAVNLPCDNTISGGLGDLDMFEADFDWQDWGQNLANFKPT